MKNINILLLGENGVGKSTFINALLNYSYFKTMENTYSNGPIVAAPITISVMSHDNKMKTITLVEKEHASATAQLKEFFISEKEYQIRVIDTPGYFTDNFDIDQVLQQISSLQELHGVCFFVKSTLTRSNESLEYCIRQTIVHLDIPIVNNIIFVITNTRSVGFDPKVAKSVLHGIVETIRSKNSNINIPLSNKNTFCVDNEGYIALAAEASGVKVHPLVKSDSKNCWTLSQKECQRLISYIQNLQPYRFPQFEIIAKIELFFENNVSNLNTLAESAFRCLQKCEQMENDANVAFELLEEMKRNLEENSSYEQKTFADTVKGDRQAKNPNKADNRNSNKKGKNESAGRTMATSNYHQTDKMDEFTRILKEQQTFIQNTKKLNKTQLKKIQSLFKEVFRFSSYLIQNKKDNAFTKQINKFLSTLRESQEPGTIEICEKLNDMFERNKTAIQELGDTEVSDEDVQMFMKQFEKIQHYQEVFNALFRIK